MMSVCTDAQGRVTGICPDNLTGGTGWAWVETDLTPATGLCDEHGTALYKLVGAWFAHERRRKFRRTLRRTNRPRPNRLSRNALPLSRRLHST